MLETIKQAKLQLLATLRQGRANVENGKQALISKKFAEKKIQAEAEGKQLDEALDKLIAEKQAAVNAEIANKRKEVAERKEALNASAMTAAQTEADAETALQLAAYDKEIRALEKELA